MLTPLPEPVASEFPPGLKPAAYSVNELTQSFLKGSLRTMMNLIGIDSGALLLFEPRRESFVLDLSRDRFYSWKQRDGMPVTHPSLSIPLVIRGNICGVVVLGPKAAGDGYSEKDVGYAQKMCAYMCRIVDDQLEFARTRCVIDRLEREKSALEKYVCVGNLAAGIIGQITSPLDGALRFARLILGHKDVGPDHREYVSLIYQGLERIADIMASLSRMNNPARAWMPYPESIDIHQAINEAIDVFLPACKNTVTFVIRYRGALRVRIDKSIKHVFTNLIKNAIEAMPVGGRLEISSEIKQAGLQLVFRDTGSGMTPDQQASVFEPFFTTKPKGRGNGFGLALCKEIIERNKGCIGVTSAPGKGSAFTIILPRDVLI